MNRKSCILLAIFGIILIAAYGIWIEPNLLEVKHLYIEDAGFKKVLYGKTAVHISDLHIEKIGKHERKVLSIIESIKPDLIFLTGDYVKWKGDYGPALVFLSRLKATIGVWAVMGDYDYSNSRKSCVFCHKKSSGMPVQLPNVRFLRNEFKQISISDKSMWIAGLDEELGPVFPEDDKSLSFTGKYPAILLCHNPIAFEELEEDHAILMLAGDTHGGQIPLPTWLWDILGYEKNVRYNQGLFQKGRKQLYVSRGVGTSHFPIRIFRRPELIVLHF